MPIGPKSAPLPTFHVKRDAVRISLNFRVTGNSFIVSISKFDGTDYNVANRGLYLKWFAVEIPAYNADGRISGHVYCNGTWSENFGSARPQSCMQYGMETTVNERSEEIKDTGAWQKDFTKHLTYIKKQTGCYRSRIRLWERDVGSNQTDPLSTSISWTRTTKRWERAENWGRR